MSPVDAVIDGNGYFRWGGRARGHRNGAGGISHPGTEKFTLAQPRQAAVQFSTLRPGILSNSRTMFVTSVARAERAWARYQEDGASEPWGHFGRNVADRVGKVLR